MTDSAVEQAAADAGVVGFNPALDALFIEYSSGRNLIAWHRHGDDRMVTQNLSPRGTGSWGPSNVYTADRTPEFVANARSVDVLDKRPFNFLASHFERANGLGIGTAWALAVYFQDASHAVEASEQALQSIPGVGKRKARQIRRTLGYVTPPSEWGETDD